MKKKPKNGENIWKKLYRLYFLKNSYNSIIRQANLKVGKRFKQLPLERRHINDQWKMAEENIWRRQKYSLS